MGKQRSRQILGLDPLRAAAAVMVMLFHYTFWYWAHSLYHIAQWPELYRAMSSWTSAGWVGVEIFFVISGFIITYSVQDIGPATFVRHRVTRLVPAALICATITATVLLAARELPFLTVAELWLRGVTFWPLRPWIDGSYWTLPAEISFYTVVFLCLCTRRSLIYIAMTLIGTASTYCNLVHMPVHLQQPVMLMLHGCFFGFGVFLYEILNRGLTFWRLAALAICLTGSLTEVGKHHQPLSDLLWLGGVLFLIASVLFNEPAQKLAGRRGAAVLRKIGLMTYPLYLVHDEVGNRLLIKLHDTWHVSYLWALVLTMVAMFALAAVIAEFAEPRVRSAILLLFPKPTARPEAIRPSQTYRDPQTLTH